MSDLAALLVEYRAPLLRFLERQAGRLLRYETAEDLLQGVHLKALDYRDRFEYRSREEFLSWLHQVARTFLADRRDHWAALKRNSAGLFRLTQGATSDPRAVGEPAAPDTGPSTFAARKEQLTFAVQALNMLLARDQQIVRWTSEGLAIEDLAQRLEISPAAAQRARHRALDRFRKAHQLLSARR